MNKLGHLLRDRFDLARRILHAANAFARRSWKRIQKRRRENEIPALYFLRGAKLFKTIAGAGRKKLHEPARAAKVHAP